MLLNIKSKYSLYKIFAFLSNKKKLLIVKYNKALKDKKKLNLNINDYSYSQRYIVKVDKGEIKEYSIETNLLVFKGNILSDYRKGLWEQYYTNGNLKFKGNYLNDLKEGFGSNYYINGKLKFEGEYRKGMLWNGSGYNKNQEQIYNIENGRGDNINEYDDEGHLLYQGQYYDGKRSGKGKEYDIFGQILYEGQYLNGKRNGKGKEYDDGALVFEGNFLDNKRNGRGNEFFGKEEIFFEGNYINGLREGEGIEYFKFEVEGNINKDNNSKRKIKFKGIYKKGKMWEGKGYNVFDENITYSLLNGEGNNIEEYNYYDQILYKGGYLNGLRYGNGIEYDEYGRSRIFDNNLNEKQINKDLHYLDGEEFIKDKSLITNIFFNAFNLEFESSFPNEIIQKEILKEIQNGKRHIIYFTGKNAKYLYQGEIKDGKVNGKGIKYTEIDKYEGEFKEGILNGKGKLYRRLWFGTYTLMYDGEFLNEKYHGKGKEYILMPFNKNQILFEGEFKNGKAWSGIVSNPLTKEKTELNNRTGKSFELFNGNCFLKEANLLNGKEVGLVKEYDWKLDLQFEGNYSNGKRNGKGTIYSLSGNKIETEFLDNKKNGKAIIKYKDEYTNDILNENRIFEAEYKNGKIWNCEKAGIKEGKSDRTKIVVFPDDNSCLKSDYNYFYEGEFYNGKINGKGILYINFPFQHRRKIFDGTFLEGKAHGKGIKYTEEGDKEFEGLFINGYYYQNGKIIRNKRIILEFNNELESIERL